MAQFSVPTNFRPAIGIAEIPVYFSGNVVALGVLLKDGTFSCQLMDSDLMAMIHKGDATIAINEKAGHYFAEIRNQMMNRSSSMS